MGASDNPRYLIVLTTLGSAEAAAAFVRRLVEERVVACGTVLAPAVSIYRWKGALEEAAEAQVVLKTRADRWDDLREAIHRHHPYEVPELLALPVAAGLPAYLDWLDGETSLAGERQA